MLLCLNPFLDNQGLIQVGRSLRFSDFSFYKIYLTPHSQFTSPTYHFIFTRRAHTLLCLHYENDIALLMANV